MNRRDAVKALMALPATATISRAAVKPSDVIVIETSEHLTSEAVKNIQAAMKAVWPDQRCVVLSAGVTLKIIEGQS